MIITGGTVGWTYMIITGGTGGWTYMIISDGTGRWTYMIITGGTGGWTYMIITGGTGEWTYMTGLGPKYSVLRYFGTRVPILQYSSVLSTRTFKKYLYSYLYSSTFKNKSTFNKYLRVLYEY